jgi:hypothetical protein
MKIIALILALLAIPTSASAISYVAVPYVFLESMRSYCEVQSGEYTACMRDQITAYAQSQIQMKNEHEAIKAECAAKHPAQDRAYHKCTSIGLTCSATNCVRARTVE